MKNPLIRLRHLLPRVAREKGLFSFLILFGSLSLSAATPETISASSIINASDAALPERVEAGLASPDVLIRATAARMVALRDLKTLLPHVSATLDAEHDATAAREEIRALVIAGTPDDVAAAAKASTRWPSGMDDALADAIARRGDAVDLYHSLLAGSRMTTRREFFRQALWGRGGLLPLTASHLLAWRDAAGWEGLLHTALDSAAALPAGPMTASLDMPDEQIRFASVWYLVRGYAEQPSLLPEPVRNAILARTEAGSDREDFGRELLRRMIGGEKKDDGRWTKFLESTEADELLQNESQTVLQYFTETEYRLRHNRCGVLSSECKLPAKRPVGVTIPNSDVAEPAFVLPSLLPSGLANVVLSDARCISEWIGIADVSVDTMGRVKQLDLKSVATDDRCRRALAALFRMSLATPTSLRSPLGGPVVVVKADGAHPCLDEALPDQAEHLVRVGGAVKAPIVKKRVEPQFPVEARRLMGGLGRTASVAVVIEMVISREGCVRNLRLLKQSPYPAMNGAALEAASQWTFVPGYLEGKPVDVIFNLTVNFRTN